MPSVQDLIDLEFAEQQARDYQRFLAKRRGAVAPDRREAAMELRGVAGPALSAPVDVGRTPLPPVGESAPSPHATEPKAYCKYCGKVFKAKTQGMAKMQKNRHEKKDHADQSATR